MQNLASFIESSPTAHHAISNVVAALDRGGFQELSSEEPWELESGGAYFFRRGTGFIAAFRIGLGPLTKHGARVTVAHSDSPTLQLKPRGLSEQGSLRTVPVEVYGSPILSTWLDRPLEIAGSLAVRTARGIDLEPVRTESAVAVIPNVAIHLNRKVNEGFGYDKQNHMRPLVDQKFLDGGSLIEALAKHAGVDPGNVIDGELYLLPAEPPSSWGEELQYLTTGRIDNLSAVYANIGSLITSPAQAHTQIAFVFDHEEIGSLTRSGAHSRWITMLLEELLRTDGADGGNLMRVDQAISRSLLLSNDATHGSHPNFPEKEEPSYMPKLGSGPAVKLSAPRRYATEPAATAVLREIAGEAGIELQEIQNRADVPAGTTVGPMSAAGSLLPTVDLGVPILAMHSARETCNIRDVESMKELMIAFYRSTIPSRLQRVQ